MEPATMLAIGAIASNLLGGLFGSDPAERQSFKGGGITDPRRALEDALNAVRGFGAKLESRGPTRLRSAYVQPGPRPVSIPGLGFQIGGGLGIDPALMNESVMSTNPMNAGSGGPTPFTSLFQGGTGSSTPVRRRELGQPSAGVKKPRYE
jgi:hypothetical protein